MTGILDVDIGNSRTKWRCGSEGGWLPAPGLPILEAPPDRVRVAMVSGSRSRIAGQVRELYEVGPEFAVPRRECLGLVTAYVRPETLGVDRWLAMLAAWHKARSALAVVNAGTALTVDLVQASGRHMGGYIVPGLSTMRTQLKNSTRDVAVTAETSGVPDLAPAADTKEAVLRGTLRMAIDFIEASVGRHGRPGEVPPRLFLAGGDAQALSPHFAVSMELEPDLVLSGLALALP